MRASASLSQAGIASRVAASTLGAWCLAWSATAFVAALGRAAGMRFSESSTLGTLLGVVLLLVVFCGSFATRRLARWWLGLAIAAGVMTFGAWAMARSLAS